MEKRITVIAFLCGTESGSVVLEISELRLRTVHFGLVLWILRKIEYGFRQCENDCGNRAGKRRCRRIVDEVNPDISDWLNWIL